MQHTIDRLIDNKQVLQRLLAEVPPDMVKWKQTDNKWCLLEMVCHLFDEERDDFRFRVKWLLHNPGQTPPSFNPLDWVVDHDYINQDYDMMVAKLIEEREASIIWLNSLENPKWNNSYDHPTKGKLDAKYYLTNWLAHDYLHIRQIIKLKFDYLEAISGTDLSYAGKW